MTIKRFIAITLIIICTGLAWFALGTSLSFRSAMSSNSLRTSVDDAWGPPMTQQHLLVYYNSPGQTNGRHDIQPAQSDVMIKLSYEPKKKGLLWYRTYLARFNGTYVIENPTPITQTIYVRFNFPAENTSYTDFSFVLDGNPSTDDHKLSGGITEVVTLAPKGTANLVVSYKTRGTDQWSYTFGDTTRVRNFHLQMTTDFNEIDFPAGTGSPTTRNQDAGGWKFAWNYPDVIGAQPVGMAMPKALNPGPVASRITYFAPVSLLFFFAVLLLTATMRSIDLHPMNYFFLACGCFAFQLLFAYLVDLISLPWAFAISAVISLALVSGYLRLATDATFARIAAIAQFAYMVLFSYSFFFDGLTGLTITIGAIVTLALLMATTARVNWAEKFDMGSRIRPPKIPV